MSRNSPIQTLQPIPDISEAIIQIAKQQPDSLEEIFSKSPAVAFVIFNKLSRLAKHYVLRLLTLTKEDQPLPEQTISGWSLNSALKEHERAMESLEYTYFILKRQNTGHMQQSYFNLREGFRKAMQLVLSNGCDILDGGKVELNDDEKMTINNFANDIWTTMLSTLMTERMDIRVNDVVKKNLEILKKE